MTTPPIWTPAEAERRRALVQFENECQRTGCGRVARTFAEQDRMQLRPIVGGGGRRELVCGRCCEKEEKAERTRRGGRIVLSRRARQQARKQRRGDKE